ncbi:PQQ-dependent sugar dehydrogenase [Saccharibacillus sp. CPCC 101409]|uniref:PQQ-dependent sugar dehydrogenase n=1 Tax=Saccharibacillus sp. CPCC 101409 TaxID=3058041 RepID=UPI0026720C30|nr:PQQ-dependent sugar dehydrogenase [Saccharibacillus sp. CPCC 101409]MDO3411075.1 PQQ-dependent sugar dehydrogenase [Saccharibacillus sp. CPCC 101409]
MPVFNSKGKMLTAALVLALPLSVYASDREKAEQTVQKSVQLESQLAQPVKIGGVASAASTSASSGASKLTDSLKGGYTEAATQLKVPWSMQFAGDIVYITQRGGGIVQVKDGKQTVQEVRTKKALRVEGEAGLTGFVLDPNFAKNKYAYVYHAYEENGQPYNRIAKVKLVNGVWREQKSLLEKIPGGRIHEGGRLKIGPDGMLYSTAGETNRRELSQDPSSYGGKILRMTTSGKVPKDNPIKNSFVYASGLRNSQGLAWTSGGSLYASDHGPSGAPIPGGGVDRTGLDEINLIKPGANYGWPKVIGTETAPGFVPPVFVAGDTSIAPSGISITPDNTLLVATLAGQSLKEFDPKTKSMTDIVTDVGRVRDVAVHNGKIYILTNNTSGGTPGANDDRLLILK